MKANIKKTAREINSRFHGTRHVMASQRWRFWDTI